MFDLFHFDTTSKLVLGLATGIIFGFLLEKGAVTRFRTIVGQFLWQDHTVLRAMLTAVLVGSVGIYAMAQFGEVKMHVKSATVLANITGGVIFGVGMAVLGYCPGTGIAAIGHGSRHAIVGVLGMLGGAAVYAEIYPWMKANVLTVWNLDKVTLPDVTGWSPWVFVIGLLIFAGVLFRLLPGPRKEPTSA